MDENDVDDEKFKLGYRYFSEVYGMQIVNEIRFRKDTKPRIVFTVGKRVIFSFDTKYLMQMSNVVDSEGMPVYEGDVVEYVHGNERHRYKFLNIESTRYLTNLKIFKIVGNIFENPEL